MRSIQLRCPAPPGFEAIRSAYAALEQAQEALRAVPRGEDPRAALARLEVAKRDVLRCFDRRV